MSAIDGLLGSVAVHRDLSSGSIPVATVGFIRVKVMPRPVRLEKSEVLNSWLCMRVISFDAVESAPKFQGLEAGTS